MTRRVIASPLGPLTLAATAGAVVELTFGARPDVGDDARLIGEAGRQLAAYFADDLRRFDLPLAPAGTPFQRRVWQELGSIPYGETIGYGELARRLGTLGAVRAVGRANGANPISILIPCHRVIGASGKLVGYGGGLAAKAALLDHERGFAPLGQVSTKIETFSGVE